MAKGVLQLTCFGCSDEDNAEGDSGFALFVKIRAISTEPWSYDLSVHSPCSGQDQEQAN